MTRELQTGPKDRIDMITEAVLGLECADHELAMTLALSGQWEELCHRLRDEERMPALLALGKLMDDASHVQFFRHAWVLSKRTYLLNKFLRRLIRRRGMRNLMNPAEKELLAGLPDPIPVYRGALANANEWGWSWTLDRDLAAWFAVHFPGPSPEKLCALGYWPVLIEGLVRKSDVIAYLDCRDEHEILVPPRKVSILREVIDLEELKVPADRMEAEMRALVQAMIVRGSSGVGDT